MNYPFTTICRSHFLDGTLGATAFRQEINRLLTHYPEPMTQCMYNLPDSGVPRGFPYSALAYAVQKKIAHNGIPHPLCTESCFQMPYLNRTDAITVPGWAKEAVFYQIFPDSFARKEPTPTGEDFPFPIHPGSVGRYRRCG